MPAAAFAHVLDRLVDRGPGLSTTAMAAGILTTPLVAVPLALGHPAWVFKGLPKAGVARPRRRLTAREQDALDRLCRAGAHDLRADYTASELKSAFRRLARQLHPDRHPGADAETRTRLSAAFREMREAYRALPL